MSSRRRPNQTNQMLKMTPTTSARSAKANAKAAHNLTQLASPVNVIDIESHHDDHSVQDQITDDSIDYILEEDEGDIGEADDVQGQNYYTVEKLNCLVDGCRGKYTTQKQLDDHMNLKHEMLPYRCLLAGCGFSTGNE